MISNDADALFYCLIAAIKRKINNKFKNEFWLELNYTSKTKQHDLVGPKKSSASIWGCQ